VGKKKDFMACTLPLELVIQDSSECKAECGTADRQDLVKDKSSSFALFIVVYLSGLEGLGACLKNDVAYLELDRIEHDLLGLSENLNQNLFLTPKKRRMSGGDRAISRN